MERNGLAGLVLRFSECSCRSIFENPGLLRINAALPCPQCVLQLFYMNAQNVHLNIRISPALYQRIRHLVEAPPESLTLRGKITLSAVVREAMVRGIENLEEEARRTGG